MTFNGPVVTHNNNLAATQFRHVRKDEWTAEQRAAAAQLGIDIDVHSKIIKGWDTEPELVPEDIPKLDHTKNTLMKDQIVSNTYNWNH